MVRRIKILAVGDGAVGKTCLLSTFAKNEFPETYVPTVFDNTSVTMELDGNALKLQLWDTAGQEDYECVRPLSYPDTDVFLVCFAFDQVNSFSNVTSTWVPEIKGVVRDATLLLVGCKCDVRDDDKVKQRFSDAHVAQAEALKKKINAIGYFPCSAKKRTNIKEIFECAARHSVNKLGQQSKGCCLVL